MKIKTSELTGATLDWAVAIALGYKPGTELFVGSFGPLFGKGYKWPSIRMTKGNWSENWSQGGPIIERENISLQQGRPPAYPTQWLASMVGCMYTGPTPLIAAMRCYVASKLGDEVDVPEELL